MAGGARPDPFRTRKLSRRAPMVLRGKPVGEQGAADRWTALQYRCRAGPSGAPLLFCLLSTSLLSVCYRLHVASSFLFGGACRRSRNRGRAGRGRRARRGGVPWPARDQAAPFAPRARLGPGRGPRARHARFLLRAALGLRCPSGPIPISRRRPAPDGFARRVHGRGGRAPPYV